MPVVRYTGHCTSIFLQMITNEMDHDGVSDRPSRVKAPKAGNVVGSPRPRPRPPRPPRPGAALRRRPRASRPQAHTRARARSPPRLPRAPLTRRPPATPQQGPNSRRAGEAHYPPTAAAAPSPPAARIACMLASTGCNNITKPTTIASVCAPICFVSDCRKVGLSSVNGYPYHWRRCR